MPFSKLNSLKNDCISLQTQRSLKEKNNNLILVTKCHRKRVFIFASKGSLTIEASIVISLFLGVMMFIWSFVLMVNNELSAQIKINNIAKEVSKNMFYKESIDSISEDSKIFKEINEKINQVMSQEERTQLLSGIENGYLAGKAFYALSNKTNNIGKITSLHTENSNINEENVDVIVKYSMNVPLIKSQWAITQRAKMRKWTGRDITKENELVYITKNGKVYHLSTACRHLKVDVKSIDATSVKGLRNSSGGKYKRCRICTKSEIKSGVVLITEDGDRYHQNIECSGIKRNVITINRDEVGDRPLCKDCGKE